MKVTVFWPAVPFAKISAGEREAPSPVPVMTRSALVITDTEVLAELLLGAPVGSGVAVAPVATCALSL